MKVVITTWQVPFAQTVRAVQEFDTFNEAVDFINEQSRAWWLEHEGDRAVSEGHEYATPGKEAQCYKESMARARRQDPADIAKTDEGYQPVDPEDLFHFGAKYALWGGEAGFEALLDQDSWWDMHDAYYKREYDYKGRKRPGYLRNAYGEDTTEEIKEVFQYYGGERH